MRLLSYTIGSLLIAAVPTGFASPSVWNLEKSTISYTVTHPLKTATGSSSSAKGKGKCEKGICEFLVAAPVNSFDSGDSNRDLHMLEVTRGGANPMIVVRATFNENLLNEKTVKVPVKVQFAGKEMTYSDIAFTINKSADSDANVAGKMTIKLSDFEIKPPSLLTFEIKNEVPIKIDTKWKK